MASPYGPPPSAPPTYAEATKGVPPSSPYVPTCAFSKDPDFVTTVVPVGPNATHMICPYCREEITSSTKTKPALIAYISGALLCLFGCICGCCLIPCCIDKCMNVQHKCPSCKNYLGTFKR